MKKIKPSNEDKMVYEFLKIEIYSERYKERVEAIFSTLNIIMI